MLYVSAKWDYILTLNQGASVVLCQTLSRRVSLRRTRVPTRARVLVVADTRVHSTVIPDRVLHAR